MSSKAGSSRYSDAAEYAEFFEVSIDEAVDRLRLQEAASQIEETLLKHERSTFAGIWIVHRPSFGIVVAVTSRCAANRIRRWIKHSPFRSVVSIRLANSSVRELEYDQMSALDVARMIQVPVDSGLDVTANRVELYVKNKLEFECRLAEEGLELPLSVVLVEVDSLAETRVTIEAGLALQDCTTGFTVVDSRGRTGILTAGHCDNDMSFRGSSLLFATERFSGSYDVQWHRLFGLAASNTVKTSFPVFDREITETKSRTQQTVGSYVCRQGQVTGFSCGTILDRNYAPSYIGDVRPTFIRLRGDGRMATAGGDSGGPVFSSDVAYGIVSGAIGRDVIYMPINYIQAFGLRVLTE